MIASRGLLPAFRIGILTLFILNFLKYGCSYSWVLLLRLSTTVGLASWPA